MKIYIDKYEGNGKFKEKSIDINKVATEIGLLLVLERALSNPVHANSVSQGLQPIIDILKDLAEPVSYGFMIKGFLKIMSGEETEGYKTIKHAIAGFIGIQWIPMIFRLIKSIKF